MKQPAVRIAEAGPEAWDLIVDTVLTLLRELGNEADELGSLDRERVRAEWLERPERLRALVAWDDAGEVLGVMTLAESFALYANGAYGIILEMYMRPASRSLGVGSLMIEAAKAFGKARGWQRIEVTGPDDGGERSLNFYRRNGFVTAGPKLKVLL